MKRILIVLCLVSYVSVNAQQQKCAMALAQVNTDSLVFFVKNLTGKQPVMINNVQQTIASRYVSHPGNDLAAEYLKQTVIAYGFTVEDIPFSATGRNIVAYKPGTVNPKQAYLVGAHYDCVGNGAMNFEGADDNASGVAALLETARVLQNETFPYTIVLAFWDEEEQGLFGSMAFAPDGPLGYWDVQASINLDMIGYDSNNDSLALLHTMPSGYSEIFATKIIAVNRLYETNVNLKVKNPGDKNTDQHSFWLKGATAIGLTEDYDTDFSPHWHQFSDSIGNMNIPYFTKISKLACAAICDITETGSYVSVKELAPLSFAIYPNPVTANIQLPNTLDWQAGAFTVYNIMGEQVLTQKAEGNTLNVSDIPRGLYTLVFKSATTVAVTRFIKQ